MPRVIVTAFSLLLSLLTVPAPAAAQQDSLPSWNEGTAKFAIVDFVGRVSKEGGADFAPPAERIAVFDNDGTLWAEQPAYVQLQFVVDRVKALAPQNPEWSTKEPCASSAESATRGGLVS